MKDKNLSSFTARQARDITEVTQRQLDYWDERGLVRATEKSGQGKGVGRRYTYDDLIKLRVVKQLRDSGLSLQKIQKAVKKLKKRTPDSDPLKEEYLITDGNRVHRLTDDPAVLEEVLSSGQLAFSVVLLGKLETGIRKKIGPLQRRRKAIG